MPNAYFQFKQFTVHHDKCAMKVCTDSCIFGAWVAQKIAPHSNVLDIGAGSGLLTLILAQKTNGNLQGIEIDPSSFEQLQENISNSIWQNRIQVFNGDAAIYAFPLPYDFIITNPPFYETDLKSPDKQRNTAMHSTALTLQTLTDIINKNLSPQGSFGILLPYNRTEEYISEATKNGFFLNDQLLVKQTPKHDYFRSILHFGRNKNNSPEKSDLIIKDLNNNYTDDFISLLKDYYLYL